MYLFLAIFWFAVGVNVQIFGWDGLFLDRRLLGLLCYLLSAYNFVRWRMRRMWERARQEDVEPPIRPRRADHEPDPTFDFSDPNPPV